MVGSNAWHPDIGIEESVRSATPRRLNSPLTSLT